MQPDMIPEHHDIMITIRISEKFRYSKLK